MDFTSITITSLIAVTGIVITVLSFISANKKSIQSKATDYAVLKEKVRYLETSNEDLKSDLENHKQDSKEEFRRLEEKIFIKVESIEVKLDNLLKLILTIKK